MELDTIVCADALEYLRGLPDKSIDMLFADIPYDVHEMDWDKLPDLTTLMNEFKRVIKSQRAIVMTSQQPLTTDLINTSRDWFKYLWVWDKGYSTDLFNAHNRPMRRHEDILVFSDGTTANKSKRRMLYNPQGLVQSIYDNHRGDHGTPFKRKTSDNLIKNRATWKKKHYSTETNYPNTILSFNESNMNRINPNQKPVKLLEYLIMTYSNAGDVICDPFVGSGTTAVAARNTGRRFLCCDASPEYVAAANLRLQNSDPMQASVLPNGMKQRSLFES